MRIISGKSRFQLNAPSAVAIGKFDGLHRGHRALLEHILAAKKDGLTAAVFTFDPSPASFFSGTNVRGLMTKEEKRRCFRQMGADVLVEFPLTAQTAAMPPETFIEEILRDSLHASLVVAGSDLSFGDQGRGNCALLYAWARRCGYQTEIIDKVYDNGSAISSTRVRDAVMGGRMEEAARLLGAPYAVMGSVAHGRRIGRRLGFPTVNLLPPEEKLLPPFGVYLSEVECRLGTFRGLTNIGVRPTVETGEHPSVSVETYLYDFNSDLYDSFITVRLRSFLRPERRFADLDALKEQLARDIAAAEIS